MMGGVQTALGEAMVKAGVMTPDMRLRRLMRDAIAAHGLNDRAVEAAFKVSLTRAPDSAVLLWALFEGYFGEAFRGLQEETWAAMSAEGFVPGKATPGVPQGLGNAADPGASTNSEGATSPMPQGQLGVAPSGAGEAISDVPKGQHTVASPKPRMPQKPSRVRFAAREAIAGRMVVKRLFEFRHVYGEPLSGITRGRAKTWLRYHGAEARFVELLIAPMTDDGMVIGDWWKDEAEVERLWRTATEFRNAAA